MSAPRGRPRRNVPPCRFCRKQFKRYEHLERHERTHTREQPFLCDCGRRFSRRDLLSRHQRISHADEKEDCNNARDLDAGEVPEPTTIEVSESIQQASVAGLQEGLHAADGSEWQQAVPSVQHASLGIAESLLPQDNVFHGLNDLALHDVTATFPEPFQDLLTQDLLAGLDGLDFDAIWNDTQFPNSLLSTAPPDGSQNSQMNALAAPDTDHQEDPQDSQDHRLETESESGFASRLPSIEPERPQVVPMYVAATHDPRSQSQEAQRPRQVHSIRPWKSSSEGYAQILDNLAEVRDVLPINFTLPSKHTLSRFLEGYFRGFAIHMPFLHPVTFSAASISVELLLSLSAVGALYRFQPAIGYQLYAGAQALISWRTSQRSRSALDRLTKDSRGRPGTLDLPIGPDESTSSALNEPRSEEQGKRLQLLQAMVVVTAMASWGDHDLTQDALGMSTQVALLARELRISDREKVPPPNQPWSDGIQHEERRRTLFAAYALLNLQSVAFNVPPLLLNQEVAINLPGCASTWQAPNAAEWSTLQDTYMRPGPFQEKLSGLLLGKRVHVEEPLSSFGNYVLIHGLLQHVLLTRNVTGCLPDAGGVLCDSVVENVQLALRAWQESWEATYESTTDPSSPKGPLGFNSTAILRLVYVRLSANFGPSRQLLFAREPWAIAEAFSSKRAIKAEDRSPHLDQAVLQCIHALSIPVRVGIAFVARTQTMNWSVQHALCNLECAFLLTQWLLLVSECVEASGLEALRVSERRLVNVIVSLVRETELGDSFDEDGQSHAAQIRNLASSTMLLWAQMFKGYHVFDMVQLIGSGLAMLADTLGEQPASSTF